MLSGSDWQTVDVADAEFLEGESMADEDASTVGPAEIVCHLNAENFCLAPYKSKP